MKNQKESIAISGGGILGLSIGIALLKKQPSLSVTVFEKEADLGLHASGRNSGVLHAGFYYSPDSLKAKFCREGNEQLRFFIAKYGVPYINPGKIVLAQNIEQVAGLQKLYNRGVANGVQLEIRTQKELVDLEPLAKSDFDFLWSPTTGVSDPLKLIQALGREFISMGGEIKYNSHISFVNQLTLNGKVLKCDHFVNASGSFATEVAQKMGFAKNYRVMPFLGTYKQVPVEKLPLSRLIYPVPHPVNPFLGVHFTLSIDGKVKIGPTAIPVLGKEQYALSSKFALSDLTIFLRNVLSINSGEKHNLASIALSEYPNLFEKTLIERSSHLVPSVKSVKGWERKRPGIRAQLLDIRNGELVQDFIVEGDEKSTHILNAVSPGWTAALPFGEYVAESIL